jgi:hypothetical protein
LKGGDFLRQRSGHADEDDESFTSQCQSHQRLYWTCIKSEWLVSKPTCTNHG